MSGLKTRYGCVQAIPHLLTNPLAERGCVSMAPDDHDLCTRCLSARELKYAQYGPFRAESHL